MDLYQLKTFVTVARERSITRASAILHLSQPAVSAHIKGIEDALGLTLFDRTARGMSLTRDGERLLAKAEQTLAAHEELMAEASRGKGELSGKLRIGAGSNSGNEAIGRLVTGLAARFPGVEVALKHASSEEVLSAIRNGTLDAGLYNEPGEPERDLSAIEVGRFAIFVAAAPGVVAAGERRDWRALGDLAWIYPTERACCNHAAESLFAEHGFRPRRIVSADRQEVTRTLIAGGVGVGLLHEEAARDAERRGEVELLSEVQPHVRVMFVCLARRAQDPLLEAAASIIRPKRTG